MVIIMNLKPIYKIGTRGSLLAVTQCTILKEEIESKTDLKFELEKIKTELQLNILTDVHEDSPIDEIVNVVDVVNLGSRASPPNCLGDLYTLVCTS